MAALSRRRIAAYSPGAWLTLVGVFALFLWFDLATKTWAFEHLPETPVQLDRHLLLASTGYDPAIFHEPQQLLPWGLLQARLVLNPGAVFGIGSQHRWFFIAFSVLALAAGLYAFAWHTRADHTFAHMSIALIMAGGAGNLYDRVAIGRVRDFLHMFAGHQLPSGWTWPSTANTELFPWVFNVADVLLLVGMVCLMRHIKRMRALRPQAQ